MITVVILIVLFVVIIATINNNDDLVFKDEGEMSGIINGIWQTGRRISYKLSF